MARRSAAVAARRPLTMAPWMDPVSRWSPATTSHSPRDTGLPVTTPVAVRPWFIEKVSMIQAMTCSFVLMSGAGISLSGPIRMLISLA